MQVGLISNKANPCMTSHTSMRGQALIEFAIILILLILVVAGGAELAITAYGSSKVSDAAKAGTTEWGQMISHAKNALAPNVTPQTDVGLGDHALANFASPSCVALNGDSGDYDDGMPDDRYLLDKKNRDNYQILVNAASVTKSIYLFNPMPINNISCNDTDTDPNRGGRSRISILINGYGLMYDDNGTPNNLSDDTPNPLYVPGLPKVNQAMYSMYQQVCLSGDNLNRCENATEILLFPPGKLCLSADPNDEHCPDDDDGYVPANIGETGYYFFGANNVAPEPASGPGQYIPSLAPKFRPTFQIECLGDDAYDNSASNMVNCDTQTAPAAVCWQAGVPSTSSLACPLKVHVRYRSIFESFITFGMAELPTDNLDLLPFFYNPSKVGNGSNNVKGIAGSEIGPIGGSGNPTVKPFKDFRGCYESVFPEVTSLNYQVVSCN